MTTKRTWAEIKASRPDTPERRAAYRGAQRAHELGDQIRDLREAADISQRELAERVGTSQPAIARLEAGGTEPTLDLLDRCAEALGTVLTIGFGAVGASGALASEAITPLAIEQLMTGIRVILRPAIDQAWGVVLVPPGRDIVELTVRSDVEPKKVDLMTAFKNASSLAAVGAAKRPTKARGAKKAATAKRR
jgi:HTH-type transcriptional regulator/antitoxin HipB